MKLLFDLFPVLLFFIAYKFYDLFFATGVAMIAVIVQMLVLWMRGKKPDLMNWVACGMILVLGGATLFFRNELFIKWKPTAVYWLLAVVFIASHWLGEKPVVRRMMEGHVSLPNKIWNVLNIVWVAFFLGMGALNLAVVYCCNTDTWVTFKLFGTLVITLVFLIGQALWLSRHMPTEEQAKE